MILHVLIAMVAGWLRRQQQQAITSPLVENRVLKNYLADRRLRLTDTERNHQCLGKVRIAPAPANEAESGRVVRRDRFGGPLSYDYRDAACCSGPYGSLTTRPWCALPHPVRHELCAAVCSRACACRRLVTASTGGRDMGT